MTGSNDCETVTDLSANFYTHFQSVKNDIYERLEPNASEEMFNSLSSDIAKLRKDFVDSTPYLPSYDRGKCEQQLRMLEETLSRHRVPKAKFSFKREPTSASTPSPTSTPAVQTPFHHTPSVPSATNLTLSSHTSKHLTLSSLSLPSFDATSLQLPRSSDITLTDLNMCIVDIFPSNPNQLGNLKITALHARSLHRVVLIVPPIEGSVLLHDVHDSIVIVGCHQFRMHDSKSTIVLLHTLSMPIIEGSRGIQIGGYPAALRKASTPIQSFFMHASQHEFTQDFDWIKPSPSPNWILVESSDLDEKLSRVVDLVNESGEREDVARFLDDVLPRG